MYGKGRYSLFFEVANFAVWRRSAKTAKINTLENFPLYGINLPTHTMPVHKRNLPTKRLFEENVARNADDKENTDYVAATDAIVQTCGPSNLCSCSQLRGEICILQQKLALSLFRLSTVHLTIKISGPTVECLNYREAEKMVKRW